MIIILIIIVINITTSKKEYIPMDFKIKYKNTCLGYNFNGFLY